VEQPARLIAQLSSLALRVGQDEPGLTEDLTTLVSTLSEAVSGYAGLRLRVVHSGHPVRLTALLPTRDGHPVVTSLRIPLPAASTAFEVGGRLVLWSTVSGALVDLAADVGYVLQEGGEGGDGRGPPGLELDADLPPPAGESGIDGLDELATIHRAAGLLIERGYEPGSVLATLRRRASADGLSTYAWAEQLLRVR
jgi:hypothetical protein